MRRGYGFGPGQSEITIGGGMVPEVKITVWQAVVSAAGFLVLSSVIQQVVVKPVGRWAYSVPFLAPHSKTAQVWALWIMCGASIGLPAFSLAVSMLANVFNRNWAPAFLAADPLDAVGIPMWLRRLVGAPVARAVPPSATEYETARPNENATSEKTTFTADLWVTRGRKRHNPRPTLPVADWVRLAAYFDHGGTSLSVRDLKAAGFSGGNEGRARAVASELKKWHGLTVPGPRMKTLAGDEFEEYVTGRPWG